MAVVVLPTPPFWLATTSTRGGRFGSIGAVSSATAQLPDLQNKAGRNRLAGVLVQPHPPRFASLRQFTPYILRLEQKRHGARSPESLCIRKEDGEGGQGPGRDHVEGFWLGRFDARIADFDGQGEAAGDGLEEA